MFKTWKDFLDLVNPPQKDPADAAVDDLMKELSQFETSQWVLWLVDQLIFNRGNEEYVPEIQETWNKLSEYQRFVAFTCLLGACRGLLEPPEPDNSPIVTV